MNADDVLRMLQDLDIETWESHAAEAVGGRPNGFLWSLKNAGFENRERLRELFSEYSGIMPESFSAPNFTVHKQVDNAWVHGFGSFFLEAEEYAGKSQEDIRKMLSFVTPNYQIQGATATGGQTYAANPRYTNRFLAAQASHIQNAIKGEGHALSTLILDVETAGLTKESGIWQLAGRLVQEGADDVELSAVIENQNMRAGMMHSPSGKAENMHNVLARAAGGEANIKPSILDALDEFASAVNKADRIVGQNISFDIEHLIANVNAALDGVKDPERVKNIQRMLTKLSNPENIMDTQVMSEVLFGSQGIGIDEGLKKMNKYTPYSIENLLLRTNIAELIAEKTEGGMQGLIDRINQVSLHDARTDVWFENMIHKVQLEEFERIGRGEARRLGRRDAPEGVVRRLFDDLVRESSAVTPTTSMTLDTGERVTHLEYMLRHSRDETALGPLRKGQVAEAYFEGGFLNKWADDLVRQDGSIDVRKLLEESGDVLERAKKLGLPVAGLSPHEVLISTRIAALGIGDTGAAGRTMRRNVSDIMGGGMARMTEGVKSIGRSGRVIGISPKVLGAAYEATGIDSLAGFGSLSGDDPAVVRARWSTVRNQHLTGLGLSVDAFRTQEQADQFLEWMKGLDDAQLEELGVTKGGIEAVSDAISSGNAQRYGVQVGFLNDAENPKVAKVVKMLEMAGLDVDATDEALQLQTSVYLSGDDGLVHTTPVHIQTRSGSSVSDSYLSRMLKRTREFAAEGDRISGTNGERLAVGAASWFSGERASRHSRHAYQYLKKPIVKRTGLIGAAAFAGYKLISGGENQDVYDESMEYGGAETNVTGTTTYERGLTFSDYPLRTSAVVNALDYNKSGHYNMSNNKYDHLFSR